MSESSGINTLRMEVDGFTFTFERDDGPITPADLDNVTRVVHAVRQLRADVKAFVIETGSAHPCAECGTPLEHCQNYRTVDSSDRHCCPRCVTNKTLHGSWGQL